MVEALGYISHYGLTPCIDILKDSHLDASKDEEINVLVSECADLRHLFKTVSDLLPLDKLDGRKRKNKINFYLHEKNLENLARDLLFLTLICETSLSKRERQEIFLDLYSNCMIRERTDAYLQGIINELIQLITEDDRCQSVLKSIVHFEDLKFKERDAIEDVFSSYYSSHDYDIEKFRDARLRHHFKERYDVRSNIIDWDFNFYIKQSCPHVNPREYKRWRMTGLAFETRLSSNKVPNRTYGSYVPGTSVSSHSIMSINL